MIVAYNEPLSRIQAFGSGIYHQASKQFKNNMSNKQISKAIKRNIASWKKQGKA